MPTKCKITQVSCFFQTNLSLLLIPLNDRRTNVGQYQHTRIIPTGEELDDIKDELEAFAAHLTAYKADKNRAAQVLQTEDRKAIQDVSMTSPEEIANAILTGDIEHFWKYVFTNGSVYLTQLKRITTRLCTI